MGALSPARTCSTVPLAYAGKPGTRQAVAACHAADDSQWFAAGGGLFWNAFRFQFPLVKLASEMNLSALQLTTCFQPDGRSGALIEFKVGPFVTRGGGDWTALDWPVHIPGSFGSSNGFLVMSSQLMNPIDSGGRLLSNPPLHTHQPSQHRGEVSESFPVFGLNLRKGRKPAKALSHTAWAAQRAKIAKDVCPDQAGIIAKAERKVYAGGACKVAKVSGMAKRKKIRENVSPETGFSLKMRKSSQKRTTPLFLKSRVLR